MLIGKRKEEPGKETSREHAPFRETSLGSEKFMQNVNESRETCHLYSFMKQTLHIAPNFVQHHSAPRAIAISYSFQWQPDLIITSPFQIHYRHA